MFELQDLTELLELPRRDVLTVCLDVDPTKPEHQRPEPAWRIWLRQALHETIEQVPKDRRRTAQEAADRVLSHLRDGRPQGRGLALFTAPDLWREYALPIPLPNLVRFGRPDLWPLLWAADEYQPHAILIVHRGHARILLAYLGTATVIEEDVLELDTTNWRFASGRPPTFVGRTGTAATRGAQRDTFEARVDDHLRRFWAGVAAAAARLLEERRIERLVIGGPEEAAYGTRDQLPEAAAKRLVAVVPLPSPLEDWPRIRDRILAAAREAERRREAEVVQDLLERSATGGGVLGLGPTLDALVRQQVQLVAAEHDLEAQVWECVACGFVALDPESACGVCGGAMESAWLTQVLPALVHRNRASLELVGQEAGLGPHGRIGALLRYTVSTEG